MKDEKRKALEKKVFQMNHFRECKYFLDNGICKLKRNDGSMRACINLPSVRISEKGKCVQFELKGIDPEHVKKHEQRDWAEIDVTQKFNPFEILQSCYLGKDFADIMNQCYDISYNKKVNRQIWACKICGSKINFGKSSEKNMERVKNHLIAEMSYYISYMDSGRTIDECRIGWKVLLKKIIK